MLCYSFQYKFVFLKYHFRFSHQSWLMIFFPNQYSICLQKTCKPGYKDDFERIYYSLQMFHDVSTPVMWHSITPQTNRAPASKCVQNCNWQDFQRRHHHCVFTNDSEKLASTSSWHKWVELRRRRAVYRRHRHQANGNKTIGQSAEDGKKTKYCENQMENFLILWPEVRGLAWNVGAFLIIRVYR
jgi:hypothetical protein